jgi:hypothetical protein
MTTINVKADRTYPVIVGRNLLDNIDGFLVGVDRVAVIYPSALSVSGETIKNSLSGVTGPTVKTQSLRKCCNSVGMLWVRRDSPVTT